MLTRKTLNRLSGGVSVLLVSAAFIPIIATNGTGFRQGLVFYVLVALFVLAALTWLLTLDVVARQMPMTWRGFSTGITASLEYGAFVLLSMRNDGATLRDAGVTLLGPELCSPLIRRGNDGAPHGIRERGVQVVLEPHGQPVKGNRWHEKG